MRNSIIAITAALALGIASSVSAEYDGGLIQGSSVTAGSISGATTTETGFAGTYGISDMSAGSSGKLRTGNSIGVVRGTSYVIGHSESGTLVEGAGAAGSIAGGTAEAGFAGMSYFDSRHGNGEVGAVGYSTGSSWAATGSIGDGEGISVQGFEAYGNAGAKADIERTGRSRYEITTDVKTSSGALTYTIEEGNAIGQTHAVGGGLAGADAWRVHGNGDDGGDGGDCVANGGSGNCGINGNGTGNEGNGQGPQ